jgi:hypothetical protein
MLSNRPAVSPWKPRKQALQERAGTPPGLDTGEPAPDREHQLVESTLPPVQVYAGPGGHRTIVMSLHKPG